MSKVTKLRSVTLSNPVTIDGESVSKINLRKPMVGDLRGLKLTNVLQMDVDALTRLLPRITNPPLNESQISSELEPDDFTELASKTLLFFVKQAQLDGQVLELEEPAG